MNECTPMSLEDMKKLSNQELINLVEEAKGHTSGDEFRNYMKTNFSYSALTDEITKRGGRNGWYFIIDNVGSVISMYEPKNNTQFERRTMCIEPDILQEWDELVASSVLSAKVLSSVALKHFIDDYNNGIIKFNVK